MREIAGNVRQRRQEQISEAMPLQSTTRGEAVVEKPRKHCFLFTEGGHAVADIAGGQHIEIAAQPSGTAAIVGNGNHGRDVDNRFAGPERRPCILLET